MPSNRLASRNRPVTWVLVIVVGVVVIALVGWEASLLLKRSAQVLPAPALSTPTPAATATAVRPTVAASTSTATVTWTPTTTPTLPPTRVSQGASTQTPTSALSSPPSPTHTAAPTSTPTHVPTVAPTFTPTPIVCADLAALTEMDIAPGQPFECTTHQDAITEELRGIPEVPCSDVAILFENGEFSFVCAGRVKVTVAGVVGAKDCQIEVEITKGVPGFTGAMQILIDSLLKFFPYDRLCFEHVEIGDGVMAVSGYGR